MVSASNLSLTFVVVCALAGSFASPLPGPAVEVGTSSSPTANLEHSITQIQAQVKESFKNLTRISEWMVIRLQQVVRNTLEDGFENLAAWAVDLLLRMETFMIADGSHYSFPLTSRPELEAQYKTAAISVSKLLRNLKTMKRADKLITETVRKVVNELGLKDMKVAGSPEKYFKTVLHKYFETLDHTFTDDTELGVEYKKQFAEATEFVKQNPKETGGPLIHMGSENPKVPNIQYVEAFLQDKVIFRQIIANKVFLKEASKNLFMIFSPTEHKRFLMANALIEKGASLDSSKANKINEIYQKALAVAGEVNVNKDSWVIAEALFRAIEKDLESEHTLQREILLSMNEIDSKTVYNIDMLHLDFSPL